MVTLKYVVVVFHCFSLCLVFLVGFSRFICHRAFTHPMLLLFVCDLCVMFIITVTSLSCHVVCFCPSSICFGSGIFILCFLLRVLHCHLFCKTVPENTYQFELG